MRLINEDLSIYAEHHSLIDPERAISPSAMGVHHITQEMVWDAPTLSEWAALTGNPFDSDELVIIGHNIRFDERMLAEILPERYRRICTLKLARLAFPDLPDHKLQTIRYAFGLTAGDAHRAMGDVITCHSFLPVLMDKLGTDLHGLVQLSHKPMDPDSLITFGKHKGKLTLRKLPRDYVDWLLDPVRTLDPDLREALEAIFR